MIFLAVVSNFKINIYNKYGRQYFISNVISATLTELVKFRYPWQLNPQYNFDLARKNNLNFKQTWIAHY